VPRHVARVNPLREFRGCEMSSRTLLAGTLLIVCLGVTGCTGRQILSMRQHQEKPSSAAAPRPVAPGGTPAAPPTGPAIAATTDYPKNTGAPRPTPPAEFASIKSPVKPTPDNIAKGKALFVANCAPCHGTGGAGDGPAAVALNPKPADFKTPIHTKLPDGYWFWRLSKGGSVPPFNASGSAMPPWEGTLTPDQRWLVILYEHTFSETK